MDYHFHGNAASGSSIGCPIQPDQPGYGQDPLDHNEIFNLISEQYSLNIVSPLIWGMSSTTSPNNVYDWFDGGEEYVDASTGNIVRYGVETSNFNTSIQMMGHQVFLNVSNATGFSGWNQETPWIGNLSTLNFPNWVYSVGGIAGLAHIGYWTSDEDGFPTPNSLRSPHAYEAPIRASLGNLDFLGIEVLGLIDPKPYSPGIEVLWYKLLNTGFQIPLMGGSDFACRNKWTGFNTTPGQAATLFNETLSGEGSVGWINATLHGQLIVVTNSSSEEFLDLYIEGFPIGSTLQYSSGRNVQAKVSYDLNRNAVISLVMNGSVIQSRNVSAGTGTETFNIFVGDSSWIAARANFSGDYVNFLHTNPTYVEINSHPIRTSRFDAIYFFDYIDHLMNQIDSGAFADPNFSVVASNFDNVTQERIEENFDGDIREKYLAAKEDYRDRADLGNGLIIRNSFGMTIAWFDQSGDILIIGKKDTGKIPEPDNNLNEFIIQNETGGPVFMVNSTGSMILNSISENQSSCTPSGTDFVIMDSNGVNVTTIDMDGNLCTIGSVVEKP